MTTEAAGQGLEILKHQATRRRPLRLPPGTLRFLGLLLPALLAALVAGGERPGSVIVLAYLVPLALVLCDLSHRLLERRAQLHMVLLGTALAGVALEPGWLNMTLAWALVVATAIEARSPGVHHALGAATAVLRQSILTPLGFLFDAIAGLFRLRVNPRHLARVPIASLVLPAMAVSVFVLLFAFANPVIAEFLKKIDVSNPLAWLDALVNELARFESLIFFATLMLVWPVLRGRTMAQGPRLVDEMSLPLWYRLFFKPSAVGLTLILLNILFAVENVLDLQHLWLTPAVPGSYNHAQYVHRGAYTLIVTVSLAGLLMMTALRKGSVTEATPIVRKLVYLFAAQNLFLVASSVNRTLLYIDAYGWTEWRVSGLAWMALVFFGLLSIFWRVLRFRDNRWLINVNILAAVALLAAFSVWNMQGFIAHRNVERALAAMMPALDTDYLQTLSSNAIPALAQYEMALLQRPDMPSLSRAAESARAAATLRALTYWRNAHQSDWRSWTIRHVLQNPRPPHELD